MSEADPHITFRYVENGRTVYQHCSVAHKYIATGVAEPASEEDAAVYATWSGHEITQAAPAEQPSSTEPGPEPAAAPNVDVNVDADGWPNGYTWKQTGNWFEVFSPSGELVKSETASGKFNGEDAAQEAAWKHADTE